MPLAQVAAIAGGAIIGSQIARRSRPGPAPQPTPVISPVPRRVEVDVAAAGRQERELAARRRGQFRSVLTRGIDLGTANTSQTQLLGL